MLPDSGMILELILDYWPMKSLLTAITTGSVIVASMPVPKSEQQKGLVLIFHVACLVSMGVCGSG